LTGAGGCGKTRLAIQVALGLVDRYPDGVWLAELAVLANPALAPQVIAESLGIREEPGRPLMATLTDQLRARHLLLVLDNCEHLIEGVAPRVQTLLYGCPNLHILATSREILRIAGEVIYQVAPLSLPNPKHTPAREQLMFYEATRLFIDRASQAYPEFKLTDQNAPLIARVCQRLDGIPLALELAAARVRFLSVEQIAERLHDRFQFLTNSEREALPQHRTLRASIDWSFDLLSEPERRLLRRLAVFAGGGALAAIEAVCGGVEISAPQVLDLLTQLVNKSLVVADRVQGQETRYRLLETIRQYAQERLLAAGELDATRAGHLRFYLQLAEAAEPQLEGAQQAAWLDRLEQDHDNLRTALEWAIATRQTDLGVKLGVALRQFWFMRGYLSEGRMRLEEILARPATTLSLVAQAQALNSAGLLARYQADYAAAQAHIRASLAIQRQLGDEKGIADALSNLGYVTLHQGDDGAAGILYEESLAINRQLGNEQGMADSLSHLALVAFQHGDYATANTLDHQSLVIWRKLGDQQGVAWALNKLGHTAADQGRSGSRAGCIWRVWLSVPNWVTNGASCGRWRVLRVWRPPTDNLSAPSGWREQLRSGVSSLEHRRPRRIAPCWNAGWRPPVRR
jgi:predicted ATPase